MSVIERLVFLSSIVDEVQIHSDKLYGFSPYFSFKIKQGLPEVTKPVRVKADAISLLKYFSTPSFTLEGGKLFIRDKAKEMEVSTTEPDELPEYVNDYVEPEGENFVALWEGLDVVKLLLTLFELKEYRFVGVVNPTFRAVHVDPSRNLALVLGNGIIAQSQIPAPASSAPDAEPFALLVDVVEVMERLDLTTTFVPDKFLVSDAGTFIEFSSGMFYYPCLRSDVDIAGVLKEFDHIHKGKELWVAEASFIGEELRSVIDNGVVKFDFEQGDRLMLEYRSSDGKLRWRDVVGVLLEGEPTIVEVDAQCFKSLLRSQKRFTLTLYDAGLRFYTDSMVEGLIALLGS